MQVMYFIKDWWFLITAFCSFFYAGFVGLHTINNTLISIRHELELSNNRMKDSAKDRKRIWGRIEKHDEAIQSIAKLSEANRINIENLKRNEK